MPWLYSIITELARDGGTVRAKPTRYHETGKGVMGDLDC